MSHYTLLTIGIEEYDLDSFMERYNETRKVAPYISKTKEEIYKIGKQRLQEGRAPSGITTPEEFYNYYVDDSDVDEQGNLMSTYNPESRWDYYTVKETYTAKIIKEIIKKKIENYSSDTDELIWRVVVEDRKDLLEGISTADRFGLFWGIPGKEDMIQIYSDLEGYIAHEKKAVAALSYSVMTPDGEWHEPGKVGWWGTTSASAEDESQWEENYYNKFIKDLPEDTTVMFIDCHI